MPVQVTPPSSTIKIVYDGVEIQNFVLYSQCSFECQANAVPGTARLVVKDSEQELMFSTGKEIYLYVDDIKMWGGLVMRVGRQYAFPVDDTADVASVKTRQWVLECSDFNIWFDKRVIRNPADYLHAIITEGVHKDGHLIRELLPNYIDVPPGVTIEAPNVMDIEDFGERGNEEGVFQVRYAWVTQGTPWRRQMDEFAARSAAQYYIDADKRLMFENLDRQTVNWSFVDRGADAVSRVPIREVSAQEDGSIIINDALVWGGLQAEEAIFFSRYQNSGAQDTYGRWQYAEQRFQEGNTQNTVEERAKYIVDGPPGADPFGTSTGLRYPLWRVTLTWFAHDVPRVDGVPQHIRPGNLVNILLYVMGDDLEHPLINFLPLRNMQVTFPQVKTTGQAWVKFTGEFGISYSDSRYLWAYLLSRGKLTTRQIVGGVNNHSTSSSFGDFARLTPNEPPDGSRKTFTFRFPLIAESMRVYVNGLRWRENFEYTVTGSNEVTFNVALAADDKVYIEARTGQG